jgi:linoleoyl-CoA desaturase
VLPTIDELRRARRRLHAKAFAIATILSVSYYALVVYDSAAALRIAAAMVMVVALIAVGTSVMHDANHGAFSQRRWVNRILAYTSDTLGASSWLWRIQHNALHHGNTNVPGFDADLCLAPFARLAPWQPWRRRFRWQHWYIWPLYGFLAMKNLIVSDALTLVKRRMGDQPLRRRFSAGDVTRMALGKVAHLSWAVIVPLWFNPWWAVLAFYLACSWLVGFFLAIVFQLAHCVDAAEFTDGEVARRGDDFAQHQLRTTVDVSSPMPVVGHFFRWAVGGLDHQIEHHLAPRLPHTAYAKVALRFRDACQQHGIRYRIHPGIWAAVCSHARWLRVMGTEPSVAVGSYFGTLAGNQDGG